MKVLWSDTANAHLAEIYEYISRDSPRYALRMIDRITSRSQQITHAPEFGQIVPEYNDENVREVLVGPYRVIYRIETDQAVVLSVVHGARKGPVHTEQTET